MSEQFPGEPEFDHVAANFGEEDRTNAALGVNADLISGLESGVLSADDPRVEDSKVAIEGLMGSCDLPNRYCRFYGQDEVSVCDRSCSGSIWDQI